MSSDVIGEEVTVTEITDDGATASAPIDEVENPEDVALPSDEGNTEEKEEGVSEAKEGDDETPPSEEPPKSLIEEYTSKFKEAGEITQEMYDDLAAKGYDKDTVDTLKAGIEAKSQADAVVVLEAAGTTPEAFNEAINWAKENWSEAQVAEYNEAIGTAEGTAQKLIIQSLMNSYTTGNPAEDTTPVHSGATNIPKSSQGYESMDDMITDMHDRRYEPGTAYYNKVQAKAARSKF